MNQELNLKGFTELNSLEMESIDGGNWYEEVLKACGIVIVVSLGAGAVATLV